MKNIFLFLAIISTTLSSIANDSIYEINDILINKINIYRAEKGLPELSYDSRADSSSLYHCKYIAELGIVTHYEEDTITGIPMLPEIDNRLSKFGLTKYWVMGENIAGVFDTMILSRDSLVTIVIEGWKNSNSHNMMLLNPHITKIGVNMVKGDHETYYYEDEITGDIIKHVNYINSWLFVMNVFTEKNI